MRGMGCQSHSRPVCRFLRETTFAPRAGATASSKSAFRSVKRSKPSRKAWTVIGRDDMPGWLPAGVVTASIPMLVFAGQLDHRTVEFFVSGRQQAIAHQGCAVNRLALLRKQAGDASRQVDLAQAVMPLRVEAAQLHRLVSLISLELIDEEDCAGAIGRDVA